MTPVILEFGGCGPGIVVLHGLMGRASTWWSVARWLTTRGRVVGVDARGHGRNRTPAAGATTEDFVADVAGAIDGLAIAPAVLIGHSMGGLHALVLAATRPDLVRAVVVEEMAPDQRGRTVREWRAWFGAWPAAFESLAHVRAFFGAENPVVGDYFAECVVERDDGYHMIADITDLYSVAAEWGERDYWPFVDRMRCPLLAIEAETSLMPPGQLAELAARTPGNAGAQGPRHVVIPSAGHLAHDETPGAFRAAVEGFLDEVG